MFDDAAEEEGEPNADADAPPPAQRRQRRVLRLLVEPQTRQYPSRSRLRGVRVPLLQLIAQLAEPARGVGPPVLPPRAVAVAHLRRLHRGAQLSSR
eukprot:31529-Pelagococcus_subviridis.AAC.7